LIAVTPRVADTTDATRVALDLIGGAEPEQVAAGALDALAADPALCLLVVGPVSLAATLFAGAADPLRWSSIDAGYAITGSDDPLRTVRSRRDAAVRVAARLVRDGQADAMVSAGPVGATCAAAQFALRVLPGVARPPFAATVLTPPAPLLVDAGAAVDMDAGAFLTYALLGSGYIRASHGVTAPRVALLTGAPELERLDRTRARAHAALTEAAAAGLLHFAGTVTGAALTTLDGPEVVVTEGFTGSVLIDALRGALGRQQGGGVVLGMEALAVAVQPSRPAVAEALVRTAKAHRGGAVGFQRDAVGHLVARRRVAAGLNEVSP